MIYKFKRGAQLKSNPQVVGEVCEGLSNDGNLTPQALVDVSRPEDAPLHKEFEWDDAVAAEAYRCDQARYIIRSIEVVPEQVENPVRAFVSIPTNEDVGPKRSYMRIDAVLRDTYSREAMLGQALSELRSFRRKYESLSELTKVFDAIDELDCLLDNSE